MTRPYCRRDVLNEEIEGGSEGSEGICNMIHLMLHTKSRIKRTTTMFRKVCYFNVNNEQFFIFQMREYLLNRPLPEHPNSITQSHLGSIHLSHMQYFLQHSSAWRVHCINNSWPCLLICKWEPTLDSKGKGADISQNLPDPFSNLEYELLLQFLFGGGGLNFYIEMIDTNDEIPFGLLSWRDDK